MSKLVKTMVTSLVILLLGSVTALVIVLNVSGDDKEGAAQSIDDIIEHAYESPEITTDLNDGSFVRIQFQILTDGKGAQTEISKRDFQLRNILIKELATMNEDDFKSGLTDLEKIVQTKLNEVMTDGKITDVYTISKILQ
ncbi:flagellar basal body-associated protein FliL [Virgibacillus sp. C22-A2]|uniref:Flagellar protein FliL n=1 Tax=Virgibacillus tibetensis TaxID=3042313 RepID=A0ABU6KCN1_9BACI|nr:flagellar basal body-associated protein FliL [Virgibacillus sp. C22-A2]